MFIVSVPFRIAVPSQRAVDPVQRAVDFRVQRYSNAKVEQWDKAQNFGVNFFPQTPVVFVTPFFPMPFSATQRKTVSQREKNVPRKKSPCFPRSHFDTP
jgi:hypothetical protein